ncbi:MAG: hypothetical protein Q4F71_05880 [Paracoccus sp. (in: a-proteobacteria)]|nr:hypothetical protein [Paracoccus sp. (in: a-proteobacteria)]
MLPRKPIFTAVLTLTLASGAALAQDTGPRPPFAPETPAPHNGAEPPSPFERLLENFASDLFGRFEPHMRGMAEEAERSFSGIAPALDHIARLVDDIQYYTLPERLENGDIIIRRRDDAPAPPALDDLPAPPADRGWPQMPWQREAPDAAHAPAETEL